MTSQERKIREYCRALGVDEPGLKSIENFIAAAFYHVALPGTLPADKHVAINTAIRRATNRIACQGRHGNSRAMGRLLSQGAIRLREAIQRDPAIPSSRKLGAWLAQVTEEHQEPVLAVEKRWNTSGTTINDVVEWLLEKPSAIILRSEEVQILSEHRRSGSVAERYLQPGIVLETVELGTSAFFGRSTRPGKYGLKRQPFVD